MGGEFPICGNSPYIFPFRGASYQYYSNKEAFPVRSRVFLFTLCLAAALAAPAAALTLTNDEAANAAPIAEDLELTTYKGVAITGRFAAVDPEGDLVSFQVMDSPARGQITVDENDPAVFWYTPYEGKKGKDSFTYVAIDALGNTSKPATVKITIQKQSTKVTYSDLSGDPGHYSALHLAEEGIYVGRQMGSLYRFDPEDTFTREEFLTLAMDAAGEPPLENVSLTGFYDDEGISAWAKGYVSAALAGGTVQGSRNGTGQAVFQPGAPITCAEAAVIIDRLLEVGDVTSAALASETAASAPAWAAQSVANMEAVSVLPVNAGLDEPLTRSEGAQMLSAMLDVMDGRQSGRWFW